MTRILRFLGSCLLIGSMATFAWAGETPGTGLPSPAPIPSVTPTAPMSTTPVPVQDIPAPTADSMSALVSWLFETIL
jgi:hypothetical protein